MLVYRIVHKGFSSSLFASGQQGRWNSTGNKVIYTAESIALAFLENMVRRQGVGFNNDFRIMLIEVPDDAGISIINQNDLQPGWRAFRDYSACQFVGDNWYFERKKLLLKVPSAVLPEACNYVINTELPSYKKVKLVATTDLIPDERIESILKKYN